MGNDQPAYHFTIRQHLTRTMVTTRWVLIVLKVLFIPVIFFSGISLAWLLAIILGISTVIEYRAVTSKSSVDFLEDHIGITGVFNRKVSWNGIANVVLKDDVLTIDYLNNRLYQKEVEEVVDESAFNAWCAGKLSGLNK